MVHFFRTGSNHRWRRSGPKRGGESITGEIRTLGLDGWGSAGGNGATHLGDSPAMGLIEIPLILFC